MSGSCSISIGRCNPVAATNPPSNMASPSPRRSHCIVLRHDLALGLLLNDPAHSALGLDRGERQLDRALEVLAVTEVGTTSLSELLTLNEVRFMRNNVVIVVTPSHEVDWAIGLRQIERRGVHANVVALDTGSFGGAKDSTQVQQFLTRSAVPTVIIHKGDNLTEALELGAAS